MGNQITTLRMGQEFKKTPAGDIPVDWDARSVKSLAKKMLNGGTPDTKIEKYWDGDIPWITGADFADQKIARIRERITREAVEHSATNVVPKGAVLVVTRTGVGKLAIAPCDIAISQDITGIIPDTESAYSEYLFWALNLYAPQLKATHQGTSINGILRGDLEDFIIPTPPLQEQKKIAEILSSADDAVEKADAVIAETIGLKTALVQRWFSRGQTTRKWASSIIGDCANINAESLNEKTPPDARFQYIDISSIESPGVMTSPRPIVFATAPSRARRVVRSGDILVSTVRPYLRAFAKVEFEADNLIASTGFAVLSARPCVDREFLYQYVLANPFVKYLEERMTGSNYPAVNAGDVVACPIPLPPMNEQKMIAEVLFQVDQAVAREKERKVGWERMRNALMQVLLTGKVRT